MPTQNLLNSERGPNKTPTKPGLSYTGFNDTLGLIIHIQLTLVLYRSKKNRMLTK